MAVDTSFIDPSQRRLVMDTSNIANQIANIVGQRQAVARQDELLAKKKQAEDVRTRFQGVAAQLKGVRDLGDFTSQRTQMAKLGQDAIARGEDPSVYTKALEITDPDEFNLYLTRTFTDAANSAGMVDQALARSEAQQAKMQFGGQNIFKDDKDQLFYGSMMKDPNDPSKSRSVVVPIGGGDVQPEGGLTLVSSAGLTPEEAVSHAGEKTSVVEGIKSDIAAKEGRAAKLSELKTQFSTADRLAARSGRRLSEALTLADQASQGLTGNVKLKLGKLFPGIDVSDEAALSSSFRSLALDELQKFSGPTTDFEFGIAESVAGVLSDPKTANIARIKSLQRNNWFVRKETQQFRDWVRSGRDPDEFAFNFDEVIETKKGVFTLRQLQDTAAQHHISIEDVLKRLGQ